MKRILQISLTLCIFFCLALNSGYSQIGANDCYDPSQVCKDCACLMVWDPVCGCDNNTYSNSCFAYISGIKTWTEGACGSYAGTEEGQDRPDLMFHSPIGQEVVMQIMDEQGHVVATPLQGMVEAGKEYLITTDLPTGNYLCQVTTSTEVLSESFSLK